MKQPKHKQKIRREWDNVDRFHTSVVEIDAGGRCSKLPELAEPRAVMHLWNAHGQCPDIPINCKEQAEAMIEALQELVERNLLYSNEELEMLYKLLDREVVDE